MPNNNYQTISFNFFDFRQDDVTLQSDRSSNIDDFWPHIFLDLHVDSEI